MPPSNKPGGGGGGGGNKNTTILGTDNDDFLIIGTSGNDTIDAMGGDDIIEGSLGSDKIDGGDGTSDFLIYTFPTDATSGDEADYDVSRIEKGKNVTYEITYSVDGVSYTDTVKNVEFIVFADGTVLDTVNNVLDPGDTGGDTTPPETIDFDTETTVQVASILGLLYDAYQTDGGYLILQQSTGSLDGYEDVQLLQDQDGADTDFEFRVWTDGDGTTHEMAIIDGNVEAFSVEGVELSGLDAGDEIEVFSVSEDGTVNSVILTVDAGDVSNGYLDLTGVAGFDATDILQFSLVAVNAGGEFFVDDLVIV